MPPPAAACPRASRSWRRSPPPGPTSRSPPSARRCSTAWRRSIRRAGSRPRRPGAPAEKLLAEAAREPDPRVLDRVPAVAASLGVPVPERVVARGRPQRRPTCSPACPRPTRPAARKSSPMPAAPTAVPAIGRATSAWAASVPNSPTSACGRRRRRSSNRSCKPSATIIEGYRVSTLVLDDGRSLTGLVLDDTPESVRVIDVEGRSTSIRKDAIETQAVQPVSLMPAGYDRTLTPEELADLVAFLLCQTRPAGQVADCALTITDPDPTLPDPWRKPHASPSHPTAMPPRSRSPPMPPRGGTGPGAASIPPRSAPSTRTSRSTRRASSPRSRRWPPCPASRAWSATATPARSCRFAPRSGPGSPGWRPRAGPGATPDGPAGEGGQRGVGVEGSRRGSTTPSRPVRPAPRRSCSCRPTIGCGSAGQLRTAVGFFEDVADGGGVPIIVHQYPGVDQGRLHARRDAGDGRLPQVVMIKMGTRDMARWRWDYEQLKAIGAARDSITTCHDEYLLPRSLEGADGALIGFAGFIPELMVEVVHAALDGDLPGARAAGDVVAPRAGRLQLRRAGQRRPPADEGRKLAAGPVSQPRLPPADPTALDRATRRHPRGPRGARADLPDRPATAPLALRERRTALAAAWRSFDVRSRRPRAA